MKKALLILSALLFVSQVGSAQQKTYVTAFPGKVTVQVDLGLDQTAGKTDILFVVDNSASMDVFQQQLSKNADILIDSLMKTKTDFNAAVISTSMECDSVLPCAGEFAGSVPVINRSTASAALNLRQNLLLGIHGNGMEKFFDPIRAALSEPKISGRNAGFLRSDANLAIVFLTNAEDQSSMTLNEITTFLDGLKTDHSMITVQGLMVPSAEKSCERDNVGVLPVRLEGLIANFGGQEFSLCAPNYPSQIQTLTDNIVKNSQKRGPAKAQVKHIPLPSIPDFKSINVNWGSHVLDGGDVNFGWVYDRSKNEIVLGDQIDWSVETSSTPLLIEYIPQDWK
jgi:hypothetical protein